MSIGNIQYLEIPCGFGGLNATRMTSRFPIEDLLTAENLTFEDDTWQKRGGTTKVNTSVITDAPTVNGLWDFWPVPTTQKTIAATSDGKIISVGTGGIVDTLSSGLTNTNPTVFVEALGAGSVRKLFSFNGKNLPKVTADGITSADIATPPDDWSGANQPPGATTHNGRLWAWMNHRLYYSTLTNHEDFKGSGAGNLECFPGESEKLVAGISFMGRLYLWKYPRGIYWVDDSSTDYTDWKLKRLTRAVGMAGPLGLAQADNDVLFIGSDGLVHALTGVQEFGDARASSVLPEKISEYMRYNISFTQLAKATAIYYGAKKEFQIALAAAGETTNNRRLILDIRDTQNPRYNVSTRDICESMALMRDANGIDLPMTGDNAGFIRLLDQQTRSKDGAGYIGKYETGDIPLIGKGTRRANLVSLEVIYRPMGNHNLTLEVWCDGAKRQTMSINMGSEGSSVLGAFVLGTSTLGGVKILNVRRRIKGDCRRLKLVGYNSGNGQNFSILSHIVGFTTGNDRA